MSERWFVGIDLAWSARNPSGYAVLRGEGAGFEFVVAESVHDLDDIAQRIRALPGDWIVAIDAPLALPEGRCCADSACACASAGIMRVVDRACAAAGYRPFPTLLPSMVGLTLRGIALAALRSAHVVRGNQVVAFNRGEPARKTGVSGSAGSRDATSQSWPPGAAPCEPPPSFAHKRGPA